MRFDTLAAVFLAAATTTSAYSKKNDAVKLSQVRTLTLRNDAKTSHRRVSAIPQLKCVGGNARGKYEVDVMRCTNSGSEYDAEDVQWTCKASLPPEFKLGSTDVICEGYDSPNDPYILKGSCGVEYRLMLTPEGEAKYGKQSAWRSKQDSYSGSDVNDTIPTVLFWLFFSFVVGVIIYSVWTGGRNNRGNAGRRTGGGGWGGGGGDDGNNDDPPPPYTPRAQPRPKTYSNTRSSSSNSSNNQQWRPGFWSGTAAGAAAGYAAGQYANRNNRTRYEDPQPGPSSWFGGGRRQPDYRDTEPSGWFGSSNRSPSYGGGSSWGGGSSTPSSSRHESTGFGGTRRR
ncbi:Store-operated calcium entry-associated regulatory factor [Pseudocercospora fuligena]|uniref:Store-operated calcium entry-associated regulatory factor n=1 Tax=Pseudocercospora fuligena TaxID=685502 RepID=A0A8H6RH55_9PEZI|nr:Store-operated calcium entry-associated regulatory factor [Pseudocercospora fuligena]